jgi:hypothetical protein
MELEEWELVSLFESIPQNKEELYNIPFYYKESYFTFENEKDCIEFTITPSIGEIKINVEEKLTKKNFCHLNLTGIELFRIINDNKEHKTIEFIDCNEDKEIKTTYVINMVPYFSLSILQEVVRN